MLHFRASLLAAAVVLVAGCSAGPNPAYSTASGSLALSRDDQFLYAVDTDNGIVAVIDTASVSLVTTVSVGASPERIAVGPDDTIYVSNRGERTISVIERGTWKETARIPVAVEPVGVAVTPDNKTLYVVNATSLQDPSTGTLMAIDVKSHQLSWEVSVGEEPRGLAMLGNGNIAVTLYKQGDIVTVDPTIPGVISAGTNLIAAANQNPNQGTGGNFSPPVPGGKTVGQQGGFETFHPRGMGSVAVAPDGKTLFATTLWSSNAIIPLVSTNTTVTTAPDAGDCGGGGGGYGGGTVNPSCPVVGTDGTIDFNPPGGTVVLPGLVTFDGQANTAKVDNITTRSVAPQADFPATLLHVASSSDLAGGSFAPNGQVAAPAVVQEPVAVAVDSTGSFVYVVNRASNNLEILPARRVSSTNVNQNQDIPMALGSAQQPWEVGNGALITVGTAPTGIALTRNGMQAFVYNSFDHSVSSISRDSNGNLAKTAADLVVASDTLPPEQVQGRAMFYSAINPEISGPTVGISCAACHLEGREDGQVWHFLDGPRQTPALVGRALDQTAPYHWAGVLSTIHNFMSMTVLERMGGTGLSPTDEQHVAQFIVGAALPDNPFRGAAMNAAQQRGAQIFQAANCGSCHVGTIFTNNGFANVGTQSFDANNPDDFSANATPGMLNVPSLLGVSRSAPYLHSGAAATLQDRLTMNQGSNQHGNTASLSPQDIDDLVSYLKTL